MIKVKIELEVALPNSYDEGTIDDALSDAIYKMGGEVLDSKDFKEIEEIKKTNKNVGLKDITKLIINNNECVVLEIEKGRFIELISMGGFKGTEINIRLTKGKNVTCTVFYENGDSFSWYWGERGYTCVSEATSKLGRMIQNCIEKEYGIKCLY